MVSELEKQAFEDGREIVSCKNRFSNSFNALQQKLYRDEALPEVASEMIKNIDRYFELAKKYGVFDEVNGEYYKEIREFSQEILRHHEWDGETIIKKIWEDIFKHGAQ